MNLTSVQLERQDFVDNAIFELLQRLNPSNNDLQWNIEMIGSVREDIRYWLVKYYKFTDEMTFYPFMKE